MVTWTKQAKPNTSWSRQDKLADYLMLQNGDLLELQNGDLLYTRVSLPWSRQAKPA